MQDLLLHFKGRGNFSENKIHDKSHITVRPAVHLER